MAFTEVMGAIGSLIGGGSNLGTGIASLVQNKRLNQENFERQDRAYASQQDYNRWYMDTTMDNIAYQRSQDSMQRAREDNAIQRRVADLEAAGLHPGLAAGSPAASEGAQAPQSASAPDVGSPAQRSASHLQHLASIGQLSQIMADITKTNAETAYIRSQTRRNDFGTDILDPLREQDLIQKFEHRGLQGEQLKAHTDMIRSQIPYYEALDDVTRARVDELNERILTLRHDLQLSKEQGIRTTDHAHLLTLLQYAIQQVQNILESRALGGQIHQMYDNMDIPILPEESDVLQRMLEEQTYRGVEDSLNKRFNQGRY